MVRKYICTLYIYIYIYIESIQLINTHDYKRYNLNTANIWKSIIIEVHYRINVKNQYYDIHSGKELSVFLRANKDIVFPLQEKCKKILSFQH